MTDDGPARPGLHGLDVAAQRVVAAAEAEARALDHARVGTEHLLLAVCDDGGPAGDALRAAGVTLAMAEHKVREARPSTGQRPEGPLAFTDRANRAIARSVRFAHAERAEAVAPEHLLAGVLDVEGTAGQVLRGLGVDVHALRERLDGGTGGAAAPAATEPDRRSAPAVVCPACRCDLDDGVVHRSVRSAGTDGPRGVVLFACPSCGAALGVASA